MKKRFFTLLLLPALICTLISSIRAQQTTVTTYVPDASTGPSDSQDDKQLNKRLADAAVVFLEVRLNSMKDLQVLRSKSPCATESTPSQAEQPAPSPAQSEPAETNADSYEVRTTIRTLLSGLNEKEKELVLDYELVKYVRCRPTTIVHRTEPISEKTAFGGFLQMGDVLEITLQSEMAPPKINIDVAEISIENEPLQSIRDDLVNRIFVRLASESDFMVRDIRGKQPSKDADYVVTGVLTRDRKGVAFTIRNAKDSSKTQSPFVPGAISQKNGDMLNAFYARAAETVVNYIRVCRSSKPLADDDIGKIILQASELLCKDKDICEPKPAEAILLLTRLSCANKQTPATLALTGDAYILSEDFFKAANAYDQSWKLVSADRPDETVKPLISAGDAWYRAQNYANAAERYETAIARSPEAQQPEEAVYLQRTRSYRFAVDRQRALATAIDGLSRYPTSNELKSELTLGVNGTSRAQLRNSYELFLKNQNIDAVKEVLPLVQESLADEVLQNAFDNLFEKKDLNEVDQLLSFAETLPLASLSKDPRESYLDAYKILRAVWRRDAKNDWENALAVLEPASRQNSEFSEVTKYFLADTYYQRAQRTSNKGDYEKSTTIFKQIIETNRFFNYDLLYFNIADANHRLNRDQDTRDFLNQRIQKNSDAKAGEALVSLCLNYLKEAECVDNTIKQFEGIFPFETFKLRKLEAHVSRAEYAEAEKLLLGLTSPSLRENELWLFYKAWTLYALDREKEAQAAWRDWFLRMVEVRRSGKSGRWVFEAANRALNAEAKLTSPRKDLLERMIEAMTDKTRPLPQLANPALRVVR